jgi:hypothetical protein
MAVLRLFKKVLTTLSSLLTEDLQRTIKNRLKTDTEAIKIILGFILQYKENCNYYNFYIIGQTLITELVF